MALINQNLMFKTFKGGIRTLTFETKKKKKITSYLNAFYIFKISFLKVKRSAGRFKRGNLPKKR